MNHRSLDHVVIRSDNPYSDILGPPEIGAYLDVMFCRLFEVREIMPYFDYAI